MTPSECLLDETRKWMQKYQLSRKRLGKGFVGGAGGFACQFESPHLCEII